ncbi:hypothetical protein CEXT_224811 [Caerostris extrusa]|uniref:Uncharacterized protein n=1 Tax=Caerostris extrusa TaxID=172846 RepID=A0AAV4NH70_CAEEX|nr:hypothetical protein CEXT_224811 [Caerostris extrusa]
MGMLLPINYLAASGLVYIRKSIGNRGPSLSPVGAQLHVNPELIRAKFNESSPNQRGQTHSSSESCCTTSRTRKMGRDIHLASHWLDGGSLRVFPA